MHQFTFSVFFSDCSPAYEISHMQIKCTQRNLCVSNKLESEFIFPKVLLQGKIVNTTKNLDRYSECEPKNFTSMVSSIE